MVITLGLPMLWRPSRDKKKREILLLLWVCPSYWIGYSYWCIDGRLAKHYANNNDNSCPVFFFLSFVLSILISRPWWWWSSFTKPKAPKRTETFKSKAEMIFLVRLVRQSSRWLSILLFLGGGGLADLWESLTSLFIYMCLMCCVCDYSTHTKSFFFLCANRPFWVFADGDFYFRSGSQAPNGWVIYGSSHLV
jgi:hypothetical protein